MIKHIEKANNFVKSKQMAAIDWSISIAFTVYGGYAMYRDGPTTSNVLTLGCGILGLVLAKVKPAVKIQQYLEKRMIKSIKTHE